MTGLVHEHAWVPSGHVRRCGDPDCIAWAPLPLPDPHAARVPVQRPPRRIKPKPAPREPARKTTPVPAAAEAVSNVVPLSRKRKGS